MIRRIIPIIAVILTTTAVQAQQYISGRITSGQLLQLLADTDSSATPINICINYPLAANTGQIDARLCDATYRQPTNEEMMLISASHKVDTASGLNAQIVYTRKQPYAQLSFSPFRSSGNGIEVLDTYNISIERQLMPARNGLRSIVQNSLLHSGNWFKIKADTSGVYKLTYDELIAIGLTPPEDVRIYSYGGKQLSYYNNELMPDDLIEIPIMMQTGSDGVFGKNDYIAFYVQGPVTLAYNEDKKMFVHKKHEYSNYTYIILTSDLGAGKRIPTIDNSSIKADTIITEYDSYAFVDNDKYALIPTGRRRYDKKLNTGTSDSARFYFPNIVRSEAVKGYIAAAGRKSSGSTASFTVSYKHNNIFSLNVNSSYSDYVYAAYCEGQFSLNAESGRVALGYVFNSSSQAAEGYIDKICLNAREQLVYKSNSQLTFRDARTKQVGSAAFSIKTGTARPDIWDITDATSPFAISTSVNNNVLTFKSNIGDTIRQFIAFDAGSLKTPIISGDGLGRIANQDLHSKNPDMLIVSYPDFVEQAERIADLHRNNDEMDVEVVTEEQIFNEFSGGTPDVSAIRNYARFLYNRGDKFKYLLLFGDGTYDNTNLTGTNSNYIMTFQSENNESEASSYVSDDFFGMLDVGEGELTGTLDIGVGRLPVSCVDEAEQVADKIERYTSLRDAGNWRNTYALIADDADNAEDAYFVLNAEEISSIISNVEPEVNVSKIYLDAYEQVSGSSGESYPEVTEATLNLFAKGSVMMEYIGHGNPRKLTHEGVLQLQDFKNLRNIDRLTFVITASCEVGRFDDHENTSIGEVLVLNGNGGAIAALATTRVVYNTYNHPLCCNIFRQGSAERIGDIIMNAKNATGTIYQTNKRCYTLLGDPAIRLVHPSQNKVIVTHINDKNVTTSMSDTINAIDTVNIKGYVCDNLGNTIYDNGTLYATVFDKAATLNTRGNDEYANIINFKLNNSILYQGKASITDGQFNFSFIMPKDINYSYGAGRISLYAIIDNDEASGYSNNIVIGGTPDNATIDDYDGPQIRLFAGDTNFINGGVTSNNPTFIALLHDESGINTTGNGIGHNITAILDGDPSTTLILNDLYEGQIDCYTSGEVRFSISDIDDGIHTLTFKAWDIYNNPSEVEITFTVHNSSSACLGSLTCYPNPSSGNVWFNFSHNQTDGMLDICITVSDLAGRKIARLKTRQDAQDHQPIYWNAAANGKPLENGIYIFSVEIVTNNGSSKKSGKMIISRQ